MAFAIVETGGKQYRVEEGGVFSVEKIAGVAGDTVVFDKVLILDDGEKTTVGAPYIEGATVEVTLEAQGKGKKLHILKFKSKSRYTRRLGHRQLFSKVRATKIAKK
jgi:large subunit ribosomal protein L21